MTRRTDGTGAKRGAPASVLLLVTDSGNRHPLEEWVSSHEEYALADAAEPLEAAEFDLAIVDEGGFEDNLDGLHALKERAAPAFLPYLLLVSERNTGVVETDETRLVDSVVWQTINDVLSVPVGKTELFWRVESLLRQRRQSQELQDTLDGLSDPVFVRRSDGTVLSVNQTAVERYGYTEATLLETSFRDLEPGLTPEAVARRLDRLEADGTHVYETVHETSSGEQFPVEVRTARSQFRGERAIVSTVRDVRDRKERTRDLRRFHQAVEATGHAVFLTDTDGTIAYANPAFETITGYDRHEVVGEPTSILSSGMMSESFYEDLWTTILSGETWKGEIVNRRSDGSHYHAHQTIAPILDGEGAVEGFVAIQTDVTDQKEREAELGRYETIVEALNDAVYALDDRGRFTYVNETFVDMVGYEEATILGSPPSLIKSPDAVETAERNLARLLSQDGPEKMTFEIDIQPRDGRPVPCEDHMGVLPYDDQFDGSVGTLREVTERNEREQQLRVMDRVVRHNLRNSMEVIRGLAETIGDEAPEAYATEAKTIVETCDELLVTADKCRTISELLSEPSPTERVDLGTLVERVATDVGEQFPEATVEVDVDSVEVSAFGEIERAVGELLTNAVVHNDQPDPVVRVSVAAGEDVGRVRVVDDCPQIPEMERNVLTEDERIDPLYHGSGLGLWLVHWVVSRSGGTVTFETGRSRGNTILVELPREGSSSR